MAGLATRSHAVRRFSQIGVPPRAWLVGVAAPPDHAMSTSGSMGAAFADTS